MFLLQQLLEQHVAWLRTPHALWPAPDAFVSVSARAAACVASPGGACARSVASAAAAGSASGFFAGDPAGVWRVLLLNWGVQFFMSWAAFLLYMVWDYTNYRAGALARAKLPSRHPLEPFWWSQLRMVPLVLYNQLVVWPLVMLLLLWPTWAAREAPVWGAGGWGWATLPALLALMLVSDQLWYWAHRSMHLPFAWKHWHKMHHVAEQTAISATFVHPVEYALFTLAMNAPFALAGFPAWVQAIPLGWGMFTGSGAHSGYSGDFANGDEHNAHHLFHNVNFGLLMVADRAWGTHWAPGDRMPAVWEEAEKIYSEYPDVHGTEEASTRPGAAKGAVAAATLKAKAA